MPIAIGNSTSMRLSTDRALDERRCLSAPHDRQRGCLKPYDFGPGASMSYRSRGYGALHTMQRLDLDVAAKLKICSIIMHASALVTTEW